MSGERDLAQAMYAGLAGASLFRWGWAALETDQQPPSLPLVTLTRVSANADELADMCPQEPDLEAQTTIETHAWARVYEDARALQDQVRAIVLDGSGEWRLLSEQDSYDSVFRAWRISAQWLGFGSLLAWTTPTPEAEPEGMSALFIPLHLYVPPEPPPVVVRAFADGFDEGFA